MTADKQPDKTQTSCVNLPEINFYSMLEAYRKEELTNPNLTLTFSSWCLMKWAEERYAIAERLKEAQNLLPDYCEEPFNLRDCNKIIEDLINELEGK